MRHAFFYFIPLEVCELEINEHHDEYPYVSQLHAVPLYLPFGQSYPHGRLHQSEDLLAVDCFRHGATIIIINHKFLGPFIDEYIDNWT